ncbi:hypothetical protein D3C87_1621390 [compost metagenome]
MGLCCAFYLFGFKDHPEVKGETLRTVIKAYLLCKYNWFCTKGNGVIIVKHTALYGGIICHQI